MVARQSPWFLYMKRGEQWGVSDKGVHLNALKSRQWGAFGVLSVGTQAQ